MGSLLPSRTVSLAVVASAGLAAILLTATWAADVAERPEREIRRQVRAARANTPDFVLHLGRPFAPDELPQEILWSPDQDLVAGEQESMRSLDARIDAALATEKGPAAGHYGSASLSLKVADGIGFVLRDTQGRSVQHGTATRTSWGFELEPALPLPRAFRLARLVGFHDVGGEFLVAPLDLQRAFGVLRIDGWMWTDSPWENDEPLVFHRSVPGTTESWDPEPYQVREAWNPVHLPEPFRRAVVGDLPVHVTSVGESRLDEPTRRICTIFVDAGEAEGVFVGLRYRHSPEDWAHFEGVVLETGEHTATLLAIHRGSAQPAVEAGWVLHTRYVW